MITWNKIKDRFAARHTHLARDFSHGEHQHLSKLRILFNHNLLLFFVVVRSFFKDKLLDTAGALVYTSLFSVIPFLAVLFALMKGFGMKRQYPKS